MNTDTGEYTLTVKVDIPVDELVKMIDEYRNTKSLHYRVLEAKKAWG